MSTPIVEQLAVLLVARLESVTIDNGYQADITAVKRPTRYGNFDFEEGVCAVEEGDRVPLETEAQSTDEWSQTFMITVAHYPDDTSTTPIDTALNLKGADIEKALHSDRQFSGLATNSRITAIASSQTSTGMPSITIFFDIEYRTQDGDPFTNG